MNSNQTIAQFLKVKTFPFIINDEKGKEIYWESSSGYWLRYEYDSDGNRIFYEDSDRNWCKREYDSNGKRIFYEDSTGFWIKSQYDSDGKEIYYEDSDGIVHDDRPKPVLEITLEEIAALKGVSVSQIRIKKQLTTSGIFLQYKQL